MSAATTRKRFRNLLKLCLKSGRRSLVTAAFYVAAFNAVELVFPKLIQLFIDSAAQEPLRLFSLDMSFLATTRGRLIFLPCLFLVFAALRWVITSFRAVQQTLLGQEALYNLRNRIYNKVQELSFAYHDKAHTGTLISNVVEDVNHTAHFMEMGIFPLAECLCYIVASYAMMFYFCPLAGFASLGLFLLPMVASVFFFYFCGKRFMKTKEFFSSVVELFSESMEGQLVIKAFGCTDFIRKKYHASVDQLHRSTLLEMILHTTLTQLHLWGTILGIPAVIAAALITFRQDGSDVSSGTIFLLFYLQTQLKNRMWMWTRALELTMRFSVTANRLVKLFETDEHLDASGTLPVPEKSAIRFDNVSFGYGGTDHSLRNINLEIKAGANIALVGPTGSGKSTLALLLCRFYDPDEGRILLNERPLQDYNLNDLRDHFSLVFQESFLFSTSVRQNISYGKPDAPFEEVVHAATIARAHDFIMEMENGYETEVGERGVTLSGGQRQRISIARAILRKPRMLVLDACTSAVDTLTEKAIQQGLDDVAEHCTVLIIAHRWSSVANADTVYVLDNGKIIEHGPPQALNHAGSRFHSLLKSERSSDERR